MTQKKLSRQEELDQIKEFEKRGQIEHIDPIVSPDEILERQRVTNQNQRSHRGSKRVWNREKK